MMTGVIRDKEDKRMGGEVVTVTVLMARGRQCAGSQAALNKIFFEAQCDSALRGLVSGCGIEAARA